MRRAALLLLLLGSCSSEPEPETVVVYTAFDSIFAERVFEEFTRQTGIRVKAQFDIEEAKTVGLVSRIIAERADVQADVFWNGESMRTCMLQAHGLLAPYDSPSATRIPDAWRAGDRTWTGFGARARVIVYNTERVREPPRTFEALTEARWKGRVAMANPRFGTTAAHVAALYHVWGEARARRFFERLKANDLRVVGGNSHVRDLVARGEFDVGLTDTDDVWIGIDRGDPIQMVLPEPTLLIPNTAALIAGAPHPGPARKFLDFLLHADRERQMAEGRSRQMPVRESVPVPPSVPHAADVKSMKVDWMKVYEGSDRAIADVQSILGL